MKNFVLKKDENLEIIILLSLLSRTPVKIKLSIECSPNIDFLKGLNSLISNCKYTLNGKILEFTPAPLFGGKKKIVLKNIPEFIKYYSVLAPFSREDSDFNISGITNISGFSTDMMKIVIGKIFSVFKIPGFSIFISKRGFEPMGNGEIRLKYSAVRNIESISLKEQEPLEKIRGLVVTSRIGADTSTRMINTIKSEMNSLCETKVYCAVSNKNDSGPSPGYECSVYTESYNGIFYETMNNKQLPEEMAKNCCTQVLKLIDLGGLFDKKLLPIIFIFMALGHGVSHLRVGEIDDDSKEVLDILKVFFNNEYTLKKDLDEYIISIVGNNYKNSFKPM